MRANVVEAKFTACFQKKIYASLWKRPAEKRSRERFREFRTVHKEFAVGALVNVVGRKPNTVKAFFPRKR